MRTISTDGMRSTISSASSTSPSVGAPKVLPRPRPRVIACSTCGSAWPRISGPQEQTQSM